MVDAVVSYAIEKLGDFLIQQVNIRIGVKNAVIWLKNELSHLQVSVEALEAKKQTGHVRLWIDSVKDVANEAVIILERFSIHQEEHAVPKQSALGRFRSCICICKKEADLYDIGQEIDSLKERFTDIKMKQDEYKINDILANLLQNQEKRKRIRGLIPFENEVEVVGFDDDVRTLLAELVREDSSLGMISIHGMGGLGKTTLARKLYDSSQLSHFERRAFVCVSQEYDIKDVLKRILKSFMGHDYDPEFSEMEVLDLLEHLRKLLDGDRYLVVVDDIWDTEAWTNVKRAFPDKKNGSRVIVTTRNKVIAKEVDDRCFVHRLRFLKEDESWQLFSRRAKPTQNLEKLGKEMVDKCQGLPLAIVVLSGLLLHKNYEDWLDVKNHLWTRLKNKSLEIQEILDLSYDDLSPQMKQCFLYLARFPEDHIFQVENLKLLWIAEEFMLETEEGNGVVMEDVAKNCMNELINRNMIQIVGLQFNGDVARCTVHDLVRDLAIQKAKEQKLLGTFDSSKQDSSSIRLLQGQPRHALYNGIGEYLKLLGPNFDDIKLRSLALTSGSYSCSKLEEMKLMYTKFEYLKVLDLTLVESDWIPAEIGDLVLLKFLGLVSGGDKVLAIPPTIGKLKKLQTFCGLAKYEFPREICELLELRHLRFENMFKKRPDRGSLKISSHQTKLHSIYNIWIEDWIHIDTVNLTNLHSVFIEEGASTEERTYSLDSLANLKSLQTFKLCLFTSDIPTIKSLSSCKRLRTVFLAGKLNDTSELNFLPDSVSCLTLYHSLFKQDPMPILERLSNLTSLSLEMQVYMGKKMVCRRNAFPSLQFLKLRIHSKVEEWEVEEGALPSLKGFEIGNFPCLKKIPERVKGVPAIPDSINSYTWL